MKKKLIIGFGLLVAAIIIVVVIVVNSNKNSIVDEVEGAENMTNQSNPIATITMNDGGTIELELYTDKAPNTVANFISLANSGFYDGLIFHRVISGFMIQGGDPTGTGMGNPGYSIKGEFSLNKFTDNDITHKRGVISMARSQAMDSAGSQFFIMHADSNFLDGQYAAFGKVINDTSLATVDAIAAVKVNSNDKPNTDQTIKSIIVNTQGVDYNEPEKVS